VAYENCVLNSHGDYHSALLEEMHQCPLNDIKKVIELLRVLITLAKNINGTPLRKLVLNMLEGQALSGVFKSVRHTLHHMPHAAMRIYGG